MIVVVEGRQPLCWSCKQLGHLARYCPYKTSTNNCNDNSDNMINKNKTTSTKPKLEPENHPNNPEEGWTHVTRRKTTQKQKPHKTIELTVESATEVTTKATTKETTTRKEAAAAPTTTESSMTEQTPFPVHTYTPQKRKKKTIEGEQP